MPLGRTNDALIGLAALAAIPLAALLHDAWRSRAAALSTTVFVIAVVGLVLIGIVQLVYAANLISTRTQARLTVGGWLAIGIWLVAVNAARADVRLYGAVRWLGILAGAGMLSLAVSIFVLGSAAADPKAALDNPLGIATGLLGIVCSAIVFPIWALILWHRLVTVPSRPA